MALLPAVLAVSKRKDAPGARPEPQLLCRRVGKATGGSIVVTLADMEGNNAFDASCLGTAEAVEEETVGNNCLQSARAARLSTQLLCRRVAKATGGSIVVTLADMEGNEAFDASCLGTADAVEEETVGDDEMVMIRGCASKAACTVLLRGANDYLLDEMDRSLHDALSITKRVLESGKVVAGGSLCALQSLSR